MKLAIFGDLEHVRSFGAQLTSQCLKSDILHTYPYSTTVRFCSMPNIGKNSSIYSQVAQKVLTPDARKLIRNMKAKRSVSSNKTVKYSNVHYQSPLDSGTPNTLEEYKQLEACQFNEGEHFNYLSGIVDWADMVLINGEGNIVNHASGQSDRYRIGARILLAVAVLCTRKSKKFALINCTVDPRHDGFEQVLKHYLPYAEYVTVREPVSFKYCKEKLALTNMRQGVDASVGYVGSESRFSGPVNNDKIITIGDSSGLRGEGGQVKKAYQKIFSYFLESGWKVRFLDCTTPYSHLLGELAQAMDVEWLSDHWLNYSQLQEKLAESTVMFSGRWHPSILAASCGTPIVLFGADSCKTEGLAIQLGSKFIKGNICDIAQDVKALEEINAYSMQANRRDLLQKVAVASAMRFENF